MSAQAEALAACCHALAGPLRLQTGWAAPSASCSGWTVAAGTVSASLHPMAAQESMPAGQVRLAAAGCPHHEGCSAPGAAVHPEEPHEPPAPPATPAAELWAAVLSATAAGWWRQRVCCQQAAQGGSSGGWQHAGGSQGWGRWQQQAGTGGTGGTACCWRHGGCCGW